MNKQFLKKIYIVSIILGVIVLIYIGISPLYKINEFKNLVLADSVYTTQYNTNYNNHELDSMVRQKAYKEALLKLSEKDSISLLVNLNDSMVYLFIKGVIIHRSKIEYLKIDPLLKKLPGIVYTKLFSQPFQIIDEDATIVKEPVVVRHAPKDTIEAALNVYKPDTLIQNPAFLCMKLNYNLNLIFKQSANKNFEDKKIGFIFSAKILASKFIENARAFFTFKKLIYKPSIEIKIPVDDLRAIYRAIPENGKVVICFN